VWEKRHPQETIRARRDDQSVPEARPRPVDIFVGALMTEIATAALPGALTLGLAATTRMQGGDHIGIMLDSKDVHRATVQSVDSATQITLTAALPGAVSVGNVVIDYSAMAEQGVA